MKVDITELLIIFDELLTPPTNEEEGVYWFRTIRNDDLIVTFSFSIYEFFVGVLICNRLDTAIASIDIKIVQKLRFWIKNENA